MDEKTIGEMKPGEIGYTVPWALTRVGSDFWLDTGFHYGERTPNGTREMKVERTGDARDAYNVDARGIRSRISHSSDSEWLEKRDEVKLPPYQVLTDDSSK